MTVSWKAQWVHSTRDSIRDHSTPQLMGHHKLAESTGTRILGRQGLNLVAQESIRPVYSRKPNLNNCSIRCANKRRFFGKKHPSAYHSERALQPHAPTSSYIFIIPLVNRLDEILLGHGCKLFGLVSGEETVRWHEVNVCVPVASCWTVIKFNVWGGWINR